MKKYPLIYVEWLDPSSSSSEWRNQEEIEDWAEKDSSLVKMSGWLVKETKEYLIIADYWIPEDGNTRELFNYNHKILKRSIVKRKVLKI